MLRVLALLFAVCLFLLSCSPPPKVTPLPPSPTAVPTSTPTPTPRPVLTATITASIYYVVDSQKGSDSNPGSVDQPWLTIRKAVETVSPGETIYIRGGEYIVPFSGWSFIRSGTDTQPITVSNYPGEQVVLKIDQASNNNYPAFQCISAPTDPSNWQTVKADYIHILGSAIPMPQRLSNGIFSQKGIVIQGMPGEQSPGIAVAGCDHWEVGGVDFVDTANGIFTLRNGDSPDHWYVHDNRVYNFYRESGMQFNGSMNIIENNEIYKVSDDLVTPYGCQMLNLLGFGNVVRGNVISRLGSTANCAGILFEWDLADHSLVEENTISDVLVGMEIEGGDANLIQNNYIKAGGTNPQTGILISSYNDRISWPCNDIAITDPMSEYYPYASRPHNCHSENNQIIGNIVIGFPHGISMYPVADKSNVIRDNQILNSP